MSAYIKLGGKDKVELYDVEGVLVEPPKGLLDPVDRNIPDTDLRAALAVEPISKRIAAFTDKFAKTYANLYLYKGRLKINSDLAARIERVKEKLVNAKCQDIDNLRDLFSEISADFAVLEDELPLLLEDRSEDDKSEVRRTTRTKLSRRITTRSTTADEPLPPFQIVPGDTAGDNILYNLILGDGEDDWMDHYEDISLGGFDKEIKKKTVKLKGLRPGIKIRKDIKKPLTKAQKLKEDRKATRKFYSVSESCVWKDWHTLTKDEIFQNFHYPSKENKYSEQFPTYFDYDPHYELEDRSEDDKSEITVGSSDIFIDYFSEVDFMYDDDEYKKPYSIQKDKKLSKLYNKIFNSQELIKKQKYNDEIKSDKKPFFTRCVDYYGKHMQYDCLSKSPKHNKQEIYDPEDEKEISDAIPQYIIDTFNQVMDCHGQHDNYKRVNRNLISTQEFLKLMSLPTHEAKQYEQKLIKKAKALTTAHSLNCVGCLRRTPKPKYPLTKECLKVESNPRYREFRDIRSTLRWRRRRHRKTEHSQVLEQLF
ncbi:hypothetical protein O3M35_005373 [Rhynocoris fuscipes]|uniref:Uncharacterized protein n=1 Tax=Rhynocoris fuscipes TaxID=488301 RepID=A0AAW1DJV4_9HEMI